MRTAILCLLAAALPCAAQKSATIDGKAALVIGNGRIEAAVLTTGATLARLTLAEAGPLSPLARMGHFLCLDGFGAPSKEEAAAGMPFHGEASKLAFEIAGSHDAGPKRSVTLRARLPLAAEQFTRTIEVVDGEQVIYISSELESLIGVDRPVSWAEHATLGPPFLDPGNIVVDMPATQCRVRPEKPGPIPGRLIYEKDFRWPMAPLKDGGQADLRPVPANLKTLDLAGCVMDPAQRLAWVTALHTGKRLLFGYVFRREDYPWMMNWMYYTGDARAARGIEFSTQPFDVSHREAVALDPLFGIPAFRWLPAKAKLATRFLVFYARAPEGFSRVDRLTLEAGKLTASDTSSGKNVILEVSGAL